MKVLKKIIRGILIIFILIIVILIGSFAVIVNINNSSHSSNEVILHSKINNSKKALVIYQPSIFSSVTENAAKNIAKGINDNNYDVYINYPGKFVPNDLSKYSIVVLGSPIYIGNTSETLINYIKKVKSFKDKKVLFFVTGSSTDNKAKEEKQELEVINNYTDVAKSIKKVKLYTSDKNINSQAYNLGKDLSEN